MSGRTRTVAGQVLVLLLVACAAVAHGFRPGRVLAPTDLLETNSPWLEDAGESTPGNFLLHDQATQFVPWTAYSVSRLERGEIPLWNPYSQLGVPFIANGQSAVFSPFNALHLILPPAWSWTLSAVLRLWLAGIGTLLLARAFGLDGVGAVFSAIAFMLCGFQVVWLNHPHTHVTPWLPWALLFAHRVVARPSVTSLGALAVVIGLQFLGGHPGSCAHLVFAVGAYSAAHWVTYRAPVGRYSLVGVGLALGLALAALQWIPLVHYVQESAASINRSGYMPRSNWWCLAGFLFPYLNGYPPDSITGPEFFFATGLPNTNELAAGYIGVAPIVLAGLYLWRSWSSKGTRMLALLGTITCLIAMEAPGVRVLVRFIPGLGATENSRLLIITALCLALLGGQGLQSLVCVVGENGWAKRVRTAVLACGIALVALSVAANAGLLVNRERIVDHGIRRVDAQFDADIGSDGHLHPREYYHEQVQNIFRELRLTAGRLLIPGSVLIGLYLVLRVGRRRPVWSRWGVTSIAAFELLLFAVPYNRGAPLATYFPSHPALDVLAARMHQNPGRFAGPGKFTIQPDVATAYALPDLRGYDALTPRRYHEWMNAADSRPNEASYYVTRLYDPDSSAHRVAGLRYLLVPESQEDPQSPWERIEQFDGIALFENREALPPAWVVADAATAPTIPEICDAVREPGFDARELVLFVASDLGEGVGMGGESGRSVDVEYTRVSPEWIRVAGEAAPDSWLVVSETHMEGWEAEILQAGSTEPMPLEILPAFGFLQAVHLPPNTVGPFQVDIRYRPIAWRQGVLVSRLCLGSLVLAFLIHFLVRPARRREPAPDGRAV